MTSNFKRNLKRIGTQVIGEREGGGGGGRFCLPSWMGHSVETTTELFEGANIDQVADWVRGNPLLGPPGDDRPKTPQPRSLSAAARPGSAIARRAKDSAGLG